MIHVAMCIPMTHNACMLTFGTFSVVITAFLGCVWWACRDEQV